MIVADSGPLIAFARIGRLDLLRDTIGDIAVPDAVYREVVTKGKPGAAEIEGSTWIHRQRVGDRALARQLPPGIHKGEWEAILLAREMGAQLLIDDTRGRSVASSYRIEVFGILRVLAVAKRQGILQAVKPTLDSLQSVGYWIDPKLVEVTLKMLSER